MNLLLVDDEESTREGLLEFIDWKKIGIDRVEFAENGEDALKLAGSILPDILLTDIRMPNMDGIELAAAIKDFLPECKIIFISGFADKEYLKSAIRLNALGYVEKPLNIEEVTDSLSKAVQLCLSDRENKNYEHYANERIARGIPLLKQKIGSELVSEADEENVMRELEMTGFDTSFPWRYVTFAAKIKPIGGPESKDMNIIPEEQLLLDILSSNSLAPVFSGYNNGGVLIFHAAFESSSPSAIHDFAGRIKEYLSNACKNQVSISVGIGKTVTVLKEVQESFKCAMEAIHRIFFRGYGYIMKYDEDVKTSYEADHLLAEEFSAALNEGDRLKVINIVKKITFTMGRFNSNEIAKIRAFFLKLFMVLEAEMDKRGLLKKLLIHQGNDEEAFMSMDTLFNISDFLVGRIEMFFDVIEQKNQIGGSLFDVKQYIKENYSDSNLSVKTIAEHANYSHYYLCNIFKKSTGTTINNYITTVRMEKAKELLKDKKIKLYEVSKSLGYSNPNYFIKLFKKYEGCTPTEYREKYYL